ncbi:MAG: PHP-associated domain-containing protein [Thermodesulfobacteriota bacterium]|nr:PHP-associated domain-containing protein [Thermodesulfobacteriota bacterium]
MIDHKVFKKVDLHIHTSMSRCYSGQASEDRGIVDWALKKNLDMIAITNHNTTIGIDRVVEIGWEVGLTILPGMELSTDCGHFLALFERDMRYDQVLTKLEEKLGIQSDEIRGNGTYMVNGTLENLFELIIEKDGIIIAAHIERWPTGFLETNETLRRKMEIHSSDYISALEITQPVNKGQWTEGKMKYFPKKYPCVQGSDAHCLEDIGRRYTWIMMEKVSLEGLKEAFRNYEERIIFPEEISCEGDIG